MWISYFARVNLRLQLVNLQFLRCCRIINGDVILPTDLYRSMFYCKVGSFDNAATFRVFVASRSSRSITSELRWLRWVRCPLFFAHALQEGGDCFERVRDYTSHVFVCTCTACTCFIIRCKKNLLEETKL